MQDLEFKLIGEEPLVDLGDFSAFSIELAESLRIAHRAENPGSSILPRFAISRAEIGSFCGSISPVADEGRRSILVLLEILQSIREKVRPVFNLTGKQVRRLQKLAEPLKSRTKEIVVGDVPIDTTFVEGCEWLLENVEISLGNVIGRLDGLNIHTKKFFRLYPTGVDRGAECTFHDDMLSQVVNAIGKKVQVYGLVRRDPGGMGIDSISGVSRIAILPEDKDLPTLSALIEYFRASPVDPKLAGSDWE